MLPSIKRLRPDMYDKLCKMQFDMVAAGGRFDAHGETFSELADWCEDLVKVYAAALALIEECKGGDLPPALGTLAKLESALSVAHYSGRERNDGHRDQSSGEIERQR